MFNADRYSRAELAGVSIPADLMHTIRLAENHMGGTVDIEGQIIDLLQREQDRQRHATLCDLGETLSRNLGSHRGSRQRDDWRDELREAALSRVWVEIEERAAMRAEEARRLSLRRRLGAPRVRPSEPARRRVCQLSNAWMVAR